jgi:hypothetical protein
VSGGANSSCSDRGRTTGPSVVMLAFRTSPAQGFGRFGNRVLTGLGSKVGHTKRKRGGQDEGTQGCDVGLERLACTGF